MLSVLYCSNEPGAGGRGCWVLTNEGAACQSALGRCSSSAAHLGSHVSSARESKKEEGVRERTDRRRDRGGAHSWGQAKVDGVGLRGRPDVR